VCVCLRLQMYVFVFVHELSRFCVWCLYVSVSVSLRL
jgi:hypothetical protein